ncbi:molybdate ABC transporter substrate-binding protein [Nocardioides sp. KR10-350]|uniref:molybdate ABC transporter substrate-binding protein n=1 Tax=Nocardioides cheoyonin TaxID=3156615 RepID=UPI0032B4BC79
MKTPRTLFAAVAAALLVPLAACGSSDDSGGGDSQTLTVFAAASLTDTFTEIGKQFEAAHDGVTVKFSFGGSSDLVSQIQSGAPADVFASADTDNMDKLTSDGTATDPQNFASNVLEIATPPGNPAGIKSFADLGKSGVKVVVCAAEVPCGSATQQMEQKTGVTIKPVSEEQSVTDVLGKVESGEADAGVVYVTDVTSAGDKVTGVTFPESSQVVNTYPIATLKDASDSDLADEFVDYVVGSKGQKVLQDAGFGKP